MTSSLGSAINCERLRLGQEEIAAASTLATVQPVPDILPGKASLCAVATLQFAIVSKFRGRALLATVLCGWITACAQSGSPSIVLPHTNDSAKSETVDYVLDNMDMLMSKAQCPGPQFSNRQNWEAQFPTRIARRMHMARCWNLQNRGPNCENVIFNPEVIRDPLPYREPTDNTADGLNLDGTQDGHATSTTCAHRKFTSSVGGTEIDNQYYRFMGCYKTYISTIAGYSRREVRQSGVNRLLLEITGPGGINGDHDVDVAVYRMRDRMISDVALKAIPYQSLRVDDSPISHFHGKVSHGVLLTEPADVGWISEMTDLNDSLVVRGMKLRLELTQMDAKGIFAGYLDMNPLWDRWSVILSDSGWAGGPSAYAAMHRMADGYKDSAGECTALSWARGYEFVRAYAIHSGKEPNT